MPQSEFQNAKLEVRAVRQGHLMSMTNSRTPTGVGVAALPLPNRELLERLGQIAQHLGTRSFLVGGPVRDLLLNAEEVRRQKSGTRSQKLRTTGSEQVQHSLDIDIAVEDHSREYGADIARELGGRFIYHSRFMTGTVSFPERQSATDVPQASESGPSSLAPRPASLSHIDITQTRAETYATPAVLPTVRPASIVGDLGRRDFTINAMALEITPGSFGTFIDPFDGRADVNARVVRVLHARSFIDDPTRIFRCIRFAVRLGFEIEPGTLEPMRAAIEQRLPAFLTPERILYELRLICAEPLVVPMVKALVREGVLDAAWRWTPPGGFCSRLEKLAAAMRARRDMTESAEDSDRVPSAEELLFVYWLSALPVTERFPIRKEERDAAAAIAGFAKLRPKLSRKLRPSEVFSTLRSMPEQALQILAVLETKAVSAKVRAQLDSYSKVRLAATGADLRAAGLRPGPAFREILDKLLFARLDGTIRDVTDEREMLAKLAAEHGARFLAPASDATAESAPLPRIKPARSRAAPRHDSGHVPGRTRQEGARVQR